MSPIRSYEILIFKFVHKYDSDLPKLKKFKLHEAIHDPSAYCKLNEDYIFQNIMNPDMFYQYLPPEEQIKWDKAKKLLEKILKNELPACLAHLIFKSTDDVRFLPDESFLDFFHLA